MNFENTDDSESMTQEELKAMVAEKIALMKEKQKTFVSGVFETTPENMVALRDLFDNQHEIFCPTPETTFEQFCGYMLIGGTNHIQKEFVKFAMKDMLEKMMKI
ncbi:MAG: hypothetical protein PHN69_07350 [Candidatus Pacebacteria bacterium]|nr:hypothetical protein [Candidatus Paceibacterota bacterium]